MDIKPIIIKLGSKNNTPASVLKTLYKSKNKKCIHDYYTDIEIVYLF